MKKVTSLALAGLLAVSGAAVASETRDAAFGVSSIFVTDVHHMWNEPTEVIGNGDTTYLDFSPNMGGVHFNLGPGVLAIWGNRPYKLMNDVPGGATTPSLIVSGAAASTTFATPANQIDIIYGFKVSDALGLAIGVNRASASFSSESVTAATTTKITNANSTLGVNLGADISEGLVKVGVQYVMEGGENSNNNGTVTNKIKKTGSDLNLRVSGTINGESKKFQKYNVGFGTQSVNLEDSPDTSAGAVPANSFVKSENTGMNWNLGWAHGMSSDMGMGLGGIVLAGTSGSRNEDNNGGANFVNKFNTSSLNLLLVTAGEAKVKEWLSFRAGVSTTLWGTKTDVTEKGASGATTKNTAVTESAANTKLSMGSSLHFGSITIDGLLSTANLATSGLDGAFFSALSATWGWGGAKD